MGSFSWNKADDLTCIENVAWGEPFKFLIPKEFGGEGKAKNVHAGAVGKHVSSGQNYNIDGWELVRYNPRQGHKNFIIAETGEPIYSVKEAILMNEKEVWVKQ